uniref:ribonuclease H n=1 Tax=Pogona vitticeps TaxID=103695 RepID=A0ABM5FXC1_9SAUR
MAPVAAYLRLKGIHIYPYIDDWLLVSRSRRQALKDTRFVLQLLPRLGLTINLKKSHLSPSRVVHYIGARLDAAKARIFLPKERVQKILNAIKRFRPGARVTAKHAQHLLGLMASTTSTLAHARLKLRSLQSWLLTLFDPMTDSQRKRLLVTPELASQLQWWTYPPHIQVGRPFKPLQLTIQVTTDASPIGWGAHSAHHKIHGLWSPQEMNLHINHLEMLAVIKAFRAFLPIVQGRGVQVITDNTTTMHYINKQGGTRSQSLLYLTIHLWEWCYLHHVFPVAIHISTTANTLADRLSRLPYQTHEWELNPRVFLDLCHLWGYPAVDMFASQRNTKCTAYASRAGIGENSLGDAFMIQWNLGLLYAFPPFPLIQRTLVKLRQSHATAILIAPHWPRQTWFPTLTNMSTEFVKLPLTPDLLTQDAGTVLHPDVETLQLTAWRICP